MVQRRYDKEFKRNAVELLLNSGKPLKPLARELGVSGATLRAWRDAYLGEVEGYGDRCPGGPTPREMADELRRLRKELDRVTRQRDILKKALGILSDQSPGGMP
jgi:transposase